MRILRIEADVAILLVAFVAGSMGVVAEFSRGRSGFFQRVAPGNPVGRIHFGDFSALSSPFESGRRLLQSGITVSLDGITVFVNLKVGQAVRLASNVQHGVPISGEKLPLGEEDFHGTSRGLFHSAYRRLAEILIPLHLRCEQAPVHMSFHARFARAEFALLSGQSQAYWASHGHDLFGSKSVRRYHRDIQSRPPGRQRRAGVASSTASGVTINTGCGLRKKAAKPVARQGHATQQNAGSSLLPLAYAGCHSRCHNPACSRCVRR